MCLQLHNYICIMYKLMFCHLKNQALHYFNNCAIVMDCMWLNKDSLLIDIHMPGGHVQPTLHGVGS